MDELIIEYLESTKSKSCTFIALCLICEFFNVSTKTLSKTIMSMYKQGVIDIIESKHMPAVTTIKLLDTYKLSK